MELTNEKIRVTYEMMEDANMTRMPDFQLGIPIDPENTSKGLHWKKLMELEDSDYDKIEEYFIARERRQKKS